MTVFVSDSFTDDNGTLLTNHTPETGDSWVKRSGTADLEIQTNKLEPTAQGFIYHTNSTTPGSPEYDTWADFDKTAAPIQWGLLSRFVDMNNFYMGWYQVDRYRLTKYVSGVFTELDFLVEAWAGQKTLRFEVHSNSQVLKAAGAEKCSAADPDLAAAGAAGIFVGHCLNGLTIDNFVADDVGAPAAENASMQPMHHWWPR